MHFDPEELLQGRTNATLERPPLSATEVLHVSSAPSPMQFRALQSAVLPSKSDVTYGMPESSFAFHEMIRLGLAENAGTAVHSLVGRPVSPQIHRGRFWKRIVERPRPTLTIEQVSILNVRFVKQLWVGAAFFTATLRWRIRTSSSSNRIMLVDAAYVSALPWLALALAGSDVKHLGLFADIYSYMGNAADARGAAGTRQKAVRRVVKFLYQRINGFVVLTEAMNQVVNPAGKPSMVMEGMVDSRLGLDGSSPVLKRQIPTVLYAGALHKEYGLDDLLNGFRSLEREDVRLIIFGVGPYSREILAAAAEDHRITFGGRVSADTIAHEQKAAWILANTRRIHDEFTRFSFPSKTLSYMSSGTPVMTTKLLGMPVDYYDQVFLVEGDGAAAVTATLDKLLSMSFAELDSRGRAAQRFVFDFKNNVYQTDRILTFAREI